MKAGSTAPGRGYPFLDADLIGRLEPHHGAAQPNLEKEAVMSLGLFEKGGWPPIWPKDGPYLTGQRALKRDLWITYRSRPLPLWREVALHRCVEEHDLPVALVNLPDLSHLMKEENLASGKGSPPGARYWEILKYATKIDPT